MHTVIPVGMCKGKAKAMPAVSLCRLCYLHFWIAVYAPLDDKMYYLSRINQTTGPVNGKLKKFVHGLKS